MKQNLVDVFQAHQLGVNPSVIGAAVVDGSLPVYRGYDARGDLRFGVQRDQVQRLAQRADNKPRKNYGITRKGR